MGRHVNLGTAPIRCFCGDVVPDGMNRCLTCGWAEHVPEQTGPAAPDLTRWHATTTTFGPWVKVPVTFFLVVAPFAVTLKDVVTRDYSFDIVSAADLFFNGVGWAVALWVIASMWRRGVRQPG